ncbi:hypothetical protein MLD38_012203 [Melastoma candidum]|uniref:Uncharacterized protein n=1 Tax=Melastoma candidum TaxID=119954 RepID=A0ACB9R974_9MYRT|nr:hypothetical protein MLD38_012203 [Melastoma candidum]
MNSCIPNEKWQIEMTRRHSLEWKFPGRTTTHLYGNFCARQGTAIGSMRLIVRVDPAVVDSAFEAISLLHWDIVGFLDVVKRGIEWQILETLGRVNFTQGCDRKENEETNCA